MPPFKAPASTLLRFFSTTRPSHRAIAERFHNRIPPYPYGPALYYKQSNSGLYGGSSIQFGNIVSPKNAIKNRRTWHPNIHRKRLWSDALQQFISVRVQARVLRTIDKVGGLDEYLLGDTLGRIKELGMEGWRLRWKVLRTPKVQQRLKEERRKLGLPARGWREPVQVEKEVERVTDGVVEQLAANEKPEKDIRVEEEDADNDFEDHGQDDTVGNTGSCMANEVDGQGLGRGKSQTVTDASSSREIKIPRLVGITRPKPAEKLVDEESTKQATVEEEIPNIVQADDSGTRTGRAFGKLRELFGR